MTEPEALSEAEVDAIQDAISAVESTAEARLLETPSVDRPAWLREPGRLVRVRIRLDERRTAEGFVVVETGPSPRAWPLFEGGPGADLARVADLDLLDIRRETVLDYFRFVRGAQSIESRDAFTWYTPLLPEEETRVDRRLAEHPPGIVGEDEIEFRIGCCVIGHGALGRMTGTVKRRHSDDRLSTAHSFRRGETRWDEGSWEPLVEGLPMNVRPDPPVRPFALDVTTAPDAEGWSKVPGAEAAAIFADLERAVAPFFRTGASSLDRRRADWYDMDLLRIRTPRDDDADDAHLVLWAPGIAHPIDTRSDPIHALNEKLYRERGFRLLSETDAAGYLEFFCENVWGAEGPFRIVHGPDDRCFTEMDPERVDVADGTDLEDIRADVASPVVTKQEDGSFLASPSFVFYGDVLFRCDFVISPSGTITMPDDDPLMKGPRRDGAPWVPGRPERLSVHRARGRSTPATVTAGEIADRILALDRDDAVRSIEVVGRIVLGALSLEGQVLNKRLVIRDCEFRGPVDLSNVRSESSLALEQCSFGLGLTLESARIEGAVRSVHSVVLGDAVFARLRAGSVWLQSGGTTGSLDLSQVVIDQFVALGGDARVPGFPLRVGRHFASRPSGDDRPGISLYGSIVERNQLWVEEVVVEGDFGASFLRVGTGVFFESSRGSAPPVVGGDVVMAGGAIPQLLRVRRCRIGGDLACRALRVGEVRIVAGEPSTETGTHDPHEPIRVGGALKFSEVEVAGDFVAVGVEAGTSGENDGQASLNLRRADVRGDVTCFVSAERVRMLGLLTEYDSDASLAPSRLPFGVNLRKASVGGDVDLSHVDASGGVIDLTDARIALDVAACAEADFAPLRTRVLHAEGLRCEGRIDLTGLELLRDEEGAGGDVCAANATVLKQLRISDGERSAVIPGKLDLGFAELGALEISPAADFSGAPAADGLESHGLILNRAIVGKFTAHAHDDGYPRPIDLRYTKIEWWEFCRNGESVSDEPADYVRLLDGEPHRQRHTWRSIEASLYERGHEDAADVIHKAMRRWLRVVAAQEVRKRGGVGRLTGGLGLAGRWIWDLLTDSVTSPVRLVALVLAWLAVSTVFFSITQNIAPSEPGLAVTRSAPVAEDTPDARSWGTGTGFWMALRHHVPIAAFTARDEWEPRNDRFMTIWVEPDGTSWRSTWLTPEGYGNFVLLVGWIVWPIILYLASRKTFRRLGG